LQSRRITGAHRRCWFQGHFRSTERQTRGPKGAYSSSDLRIVLPELVEAHGADAIKRELIPFV
jgi:hypothetical protein